MMYIEHFVLLAGAYNLGFLLFGRKKNIFLQFKNCYVCTERRNNFLFCKYKDKKQYNLTPPARVWDLTTPGILNDITDRLPT